MDTSQRPKQPPKSKAERSSPSVLPRYSSSWFDHSSEHKEILHFWPSKCDKSTFGLGLGLGFFDFECLIFNKWLQFNGLGGILDIIPTESSQGSREVSRRELAKIKVKSGLSRIYQNLKKGNNSNLVGLSINPWRTHPSSRFLGFPPDLSMW